MRGYPPSNNEQTNSYSIYTTDYQTSGDSFETDSDVYNEITDTPDKSSDTNYDGIFGLFNHHLLKHYLKNALKHKLLKKKNNVNFVDYLPWLFVCDDVRKSCKLLPIIPSKKQPSPK